MGITPDAISAAIAIQGENGTAFFTADANSANSVLSIGAVTGASTGANVTTLTLNGSNAGANRITEIIGNGGTGKLAIVKNGGGAWTLSGNNTFTGGLTLDEGILRVTTSAGALGTGTLSLGGGELQLANATGLNFGRATTLTGNAQITSDVPTPGSAGVSHNLSTLSIGSHTLTVAGGSNVTSGNAGLTFNGATTLTGGAIFNVTNPAGGGTTVLTFSNAIGGGANTLTKTGDGTVIFSGAANTYTGLTTVSGGELQLGKAVATNAIAGNVTVGGSGSTLKLNLRDQIVDTATVALTAGGTFNLNGLAETVAGLTLTGGVGSPATLDLAGTSGSTTGHLKLTGATPSLTFGANTQLIGAGHFLSHRGQSLHLQLQRRSGQRWDDPSGQRHGPHHHHLQHHRRDGRRNLFGGRKRQQCGDGAGRKSEPYWQYQSWIDDPGVFQQQRWSANDSHDHRRQHGDWPVRRDHLSRTVSQRCQSRAVFASRSQE